MSGAGATDRASLAAAAWNQNSARYRVSWGDTQRLVIRGSDNYARRLAG
ncbi:MAG: hypothetical protein ABIJ48_08335 [Actinomycetota bacterium]